MRFAQLSDIHLSYKQYGLDVRENDYYITFNKVIDSIIEQSVDFLVCPGDIFDTGNPSPRAIKTAIDGFTRLCAAGINCYIIRGNHDFINRKNALSPIYLLENVHILDSENFSVEKDNTLICGLSHHTKTKTEAYKEKLNKFSELSKNYNKSILLLHNGFTDFMYHGADFETNIIPKTFDIISIGHIHNRYKKKWGNGTIFSSGSTECHNTTEMKDYNKNGKGYSIIDLEKGSFENINIQLEREFIFKNYTFEEFKKDDFSNISESAILILNITIEDKDRYNFKELVNQINCLKISYTFNVIYEDEPDLSEIKENSLSVHKVIDEYIRKQSFTQPEKRLITTLVNTDQNIAEFFNEYFDNQVKT